jgi:5-methylcytosine-specific restriction endonuclease McrA
MRYNGTALDMLANYAWAEYLETCNRVTPRVLLKVSGEVKRESLARYLRILLTDGESGCFYCASPFNEVIRPAVDHVIPWSFALEDQLWDLVLCCTRCNSAKSDWLPDERFIEKLVQRNAGLAKKALPSGISALVEPAEVTRLYEVAIAADWPRFWAPL